MGRGGAGMRKGGDAAAELTELADLTELAELEALVCTSWR